MTPTDLTVRCMARQERGVWVAVCVDFSLAAQGSTFQQARERLHEQIVHYVREATTVDAEHSAELLRRRAPLRDRVTFELLDLLSRRPRVRRTIAALLHRMAPRAAVARQTYIEPLPLQPA